MPRRRRHPIHICPSCGGIALITKIGGATYADCWICGRQRWRAVLKQSPPAIFYEKRAPHAGHS
jgi:hypothetical protein